MFEPIVCYSGQLMFPGIIVKFVSSTNWHQFWIHIWRLRHHLCCRNTLWLHYKFNCRYSFKIYTITSAITALWLQLYHSSMLVLHVFSDRRWQGVAHFWVHAFFCIYSYSNTFTSFSLYIPDPNFFTPKSHIIIYLDPVYPTFLKCFIK